MEILEAIVEDCARNKDEIGGWIYGRLLVGSLCSADPMPFVSRTG
jgi:hypothetical protein